jgi:hypothetical protein
MELSEPPKIDLGGTVAELSRPANTLIKKFKDKNRKPSGQKRTKEDKPSKYHNWLTPFLFTQIEQARIAAGGPRWSTRAIVHELNKKDQRSFGNLSHTTLNGWIDRSGSKPKWSETFLARLKHGNEPGHSNGGRRGVLVSNILS